MSTQQEVKNMKADIAQIKTMLADQLEDMPANGNNKVMVVRDELQRVANQAGKDVRAFFSTKGKQLGDTKVACETAIKDRPLTSAAVAFASGMLLTILLKRK
tara:strand:- start:1624 stop:1929 length:306 start_codon:yes stop_codon:yes gene_type:complete